MVTVSILVKLDMLVFLLDHGNAVLAPVEALDHPGVGPAHGGISHHVAIGVFDKV